MKQMTCAQMGGPETCDVIVKGSTAEDMVMNSGMPHVMEAHPEMAEDIKKMTPEETTKWMADFQQKFDSAPEM